MSRISAGLPRERRSVAPSGPALGHVIAAALAAHMQAAVLHETAAVCLEFAPHEARQMPPVLPAVTLDAHFAHEGFTVLPGRR
jgi:hypothetical protein